MGLFRVCFFGEDIRFRVCSKQFYNMLEACSKLAALLWKFQYEKDLYNMTDVTIKVGLYYQFIDF